jgi:hypothetical protein
MLMEQPLDNLRLTPMKTKIFSLSILFLLLGLAMVILAGCNSPDAADSETPSELNATQAYQTVNAQLTKAVAQTPIPPTATSLPDPQAASATPSQDASPEATPTATSIPVEPTETFLPTFTHTAATVCDQAAAAYPTIDITIPDDTEIPAGQAFTKVWRVVNTGTCNWTAEYTAIFVSGEQMQAPAEVNISEPVAPGQSVDIDVTMIAPSETGTYQGNWKLRNANGEEFGIGPSGNEEFWVRIVVVPGEAPTETPVPTPQALVSGSVTLNAAQSVDLDTLQLDTAGSDLTYQQADGGHQLSPLASVSLGVFGAGQPTFELCQSTATGAVSINLEATETGTYFCYITNQGLIGWVRLDTLDTENNYVNITILTWGNVDS